MPACRSLGHGVWRLEEGWRFELVLEMDTWLRQRTVKAEVAAGFETDLYSKPRWAMRVLPGEEADNRPALVHDWLYATVGLRGAEDGEPLVSRAACDAALHRALLATGFPRLRGLAFYAAVRLGGRKPWEKLERGGYWAGRPCMGRVS